MENNEKNRNYQDRDTLYLSFDDSIYMKYNNQELDKKIIEHFLDKFNITNNDEIIVLTMKDFISLINITIQEYENIKK
jgi:hypothetical protein